ncbi:MAG: hypothetical protein AUJ52_12210 [Elusimicrobia bacterium CG1_02_63_36]|nr:MAG: hypothetical protein AUJ52_12210 [Elusimicrobia bacterium CG1_02_63_36]PIP84899.1 MAG: hypothetical protein COR54_01695 [Elusimicrobia bacterium CG22_combo_CG10-13_8_21_14_all_63_91]PJA13388.1 MAG: hypothetical protein COX66_15010 [Elusimicrobia bacterium CG_4_10_14_0_2_um_filter_63_34]PJB25623.1 MAG: hypothetical protein CO113_07705 [Elusimicrobia bacterium CG_4_9_14_3_um_filter_62_55]
MAKSRKLSSKAGASVTGKYVIDPETGALVKISERVPKVASRGRSSAARTGPCGRPVGPGGCGGGGGSCGM